MCENRTTMSDSTATPRIEPPASKPGMAGPRASRWRCCSSAPSSPCCIWPPAGARRRAAGAAQLARNASQINAALLRNNLDKFRALPFVLTRDVDLRAALLDPVPAQIGPLDEKLEALSRGVGAAAIYVLDRTGYAIAASNWREPASFEGVDYQFRPYFRGAVAWLGRALRARHHQPRSRPVPVAPRRRAGRRHARRGGAEGGFPRAGGRLAPVQRADLRHRRTRRGPAGQPASMALRRAGAAIRRAGAAAAHQPAIRRRPLPVRADQPAAADQQHGNAGARGRGPCRRYRPARRCCTPRCPSPNRRMDAAPAVAGAVRAEPRQRQCPAGRAAGAKPAGRHRRRAALPPAPRP